MNTLTVKNGREFHVKSKSASPASKKTDISKLKKKQISEFKQGLKEALLISKGDMEGIPLSKLWDE